MVKSSRPNSGSDNYRNTRVTVSEIINPFYRKTQLRRLGQHAQESTASSVTNCEA
jgi:hypothetical protein